MNKSSTFICAVMIAGSLLVSCKKDQPGPEGPPISAYRTYDLVTTAVKEDPHGGQVLLCKNTPIDRRNAFLQLVRPNGDFAQRIDFGSLPLRIENITFSAQELLITDFIPHPDGSFILVGIARQIDLNDRLHAVVYRLSRSGAVIGAPFRRFLAEDGVVITNVSDATQDLDGLPRIRALCGLLGHENLVVAARWETDDRAGVRLMRFALDNNNGAFLQGDIALPDADDRLHALACDVNNQRVILVADSSSAGTGFRTTVYERSVGPGSWTVELQKTLDILNAEPQQLIFNNGDLLLLGYRPETGNPNKVKPFAVRIGYVPDLQNAAVLDLFAGLPVTSYCAAYVNGGVELLTNTHQASAFQPFFDGDITSDLSVTTLSLPDLNPGNTSKVLPGQGLRPIGYFHTGGQRVVIGNQHPFLNGSYMHTFRLVIE